MLKIARYRFTFQAEDPISLPPYPGSAMRGVFGRGLREIVCVTGKESCRNCHFMQSCAYCYVFETPLSVNAGQDSPHPLVFDVHALQKRYVPGDQFALEITVVGKANQYFSSIVQAWKRAGKIGLGKQHGAFQVVCVDGYDFNNGDWCSLYPGSITQNHHRRLSGPIAEPTTSIQRIQLELITPYRSKRRGRLITPSTFSFEGFIANLARRISSLQQLYDPESPGLDYGSLSAPVADVELINANLHWKDWKRHSSRQNTHMKMGGVMGTIDLAGPGIKELWPLIKMGEWIHAGKSTLFGLGKYRVKAKENL